MLLKKIIMIVAAVALLGAAAPATSAATTAARLCVFEGCDGFDPQTETDCWRDATTLETVADTGGWVTLELRYSPNCRAAWARITNYRGVSGQAKIIGYYSGRFVREELTTLAAYPGEVAWTKMLSFSYTVFACYRKYHPIFGPTEWCSGPH